MVNRTLGLAIGEQIQEEMGHDNRIGLGEIEQRGRVDDRLGQTGSDEPGPGFSRHGRRGLE
jgi:hypothetical protein